MEGDDGVAGLVIGGHPFLVLGHHHRLALGAHHHLVLGRLELLHRDQALALAGSEKRGFVDQIGEVGAGETGGSAGNHARVDIGRQRHLFHVNPENLLAAIDVGPRDHHHAVEAAGPKQRRVEDVGTVGRGDDDDAFVGLEAVHLDQQLVQRLLAFVIAVAQAGAAMAADRVDFVDEDDARRALLRLVEHVAHTRCADADEHLDEVGAGDGEERHARFAGDGAGEQRLAGAGRADQQGALGDLAAEPGELARVLEIFDDFLELFAGLVDPGDVGEGHPALLFGQHSRPALAEAHRPGAGVLLHLPHDEEADSDDQQQRQRIVEHQKPDAGTFLGLDLDVDALLDHPVGDVRPGGRDSAEGGTVGEPAADRGVAIGCRRHCHRADIAFVDLADEIGISDRLAGRGARSAADHLHEQHQSEQDSDPDQKALDPGVGGLFLVHPASRYAVSRPPFTTSTPR